MARKGKVGIDYFSHDVDMLQDKKIKIIKAKHGLVGYAIYLRLLEELYRENGYYLQIDEDFNILFSDDNRLDYNVYILILNDCIGKGLFDAEMYEKYKILTSKRIQNNYCSATERRKEIEFIREYLLIEPNEKYNTEKVNVNILSLNADINEKKDNIGTQSKVKESKEKEQEDKINIEFSVFWDLYDIKTGKAESEKKWNKLKDVDRELIIKTLPLYVSETLGKNEVSNEFKPIRKNPTTYLNQKVWKDYEGFEFSHKEGPKKSDSVNSNIGITFL